MSNYKLERVSFITNVVSASFSTYLAKQTGGRSLPICMSYTSGHTVLDSINSLSTDLGWYEFNIPPSDMDGFITDGKTETFSLFTRLSGSNYAKSFYSMEGPKFTKRPKLTVVFDMPEYISVYNPGINSVIRPTNAYLISWYSNVVDKKFKIELFKADSLLYVIAESVTSFSHRWIVKNDEYATGSDYFIKVSTDSSLNSNSTNFTIQSYRPKLTVLNGSGTGLYNIGDTVKIYSIDNNSVPSEFAFWSGDTSYIMNANKDTTTVVIPNSDIFVMSNWTRARLHIPGSLKTIFHTPVEGSWYSFSYDTDDTKCLMGFAGFKDDAYILYPVTIDSSGLFKSFIRASMYYKPLPDSLVMEICTGSDDNVILHEKVKIKSKYTTSNLIEINDTLVLAKGNYHFKFYLKHTPIKYEAWNGTRYFCNSVKYRAFNFNLIESGDVLTVKNGSGDGIYADGSVVSVVAVTPKSGGIFDYWESTSGLDIKDSQSESTTVVMGEGDCSVNAVFKNVVSNISSKNSIKNAITTVVENGHVKYLFDCKALEAKQVNLSIFNLLGVSIYSNTINVTKSFSIPITKFSKGLYFSRISYSGNVRTEKIIIH